MPTTAMIEIDDGTAARINALASKTGRDRATLLRMLIESGIEEFEDAASADDVLQRIHRGEEKVYTDAEVRAELGLDD